MSAYITRMWKWSCSLVSHSLRPRGLQPARLLCPWDYLKTDSGGNLEFTVLWTHQDFVRILPESRVFHSAECVWSGASAVLCGSHQTRGARLWMTVGWAEEGCNVWGHSQYRKSRTMGIWDHTRLSATGRRVIWGCHLLFPCSLPCKCDWCLDNSCL